MPVTSIMQTRPRSHALLAVWPVLVAVMYGCSPDRASPAAPMPSPVLQATATPIAVYRATVDPLDLYVCQSARRTASPTAFTALDYVLPQLRQRHPQGYVTSIFGEVDDIRSTRKPVAEIRQWKVWLWAPETAQRLLYVIDGSRLVHRSAVAPDGRPPTGPRVIDLAQSDRATAAIDSPDAAAKADGYGGRDHCERTGARLVALELSGSGVGGWLSWHATYGLGTGNSQLVLSIDAQDGSFLGRQGRD